MLKHGKCRSTIKQLESYNATLSIEQLKLSNELKQRIIEIAHKEEILEEMQNIVDKSEMPRDPKNKIHNLIASHQRDTIWQDFDEKLALTNAAFFALLADHSSSLTNNDFRMAALIRMDLSNKDIARTLRKSVHSVHMAQTRLRKRLGLNEKDESLITFLKKLEGKIDLK